MKKLLLVQLLMCLANVLYAQKTEKLAAKIRQINAHVGVNISNLRGPEDGENKSLTGLNAGLGIPLGNMSEKLSIRTEIVYSQQGDQYSYGESGGTYGYSSKTVSRLNYLNLPVMANFQSKSGFFAEAGLQPGLLLSAKEKTTTTGMGSSEGTTETDIKKELNSFALGVPLGVGYVFKKKVGISARFTPGLLNVIKKDGAFAGLKEKNTVLSARVNYFF